MKFALKGICGISAAIVSLSVCGSAHAQLTTITFDVDAFGNPLAAPALFADTAPLTTLYAPIGVVFSGPIPGNGGAILNDSTFTNDALSFVNFLAFNPQATGAGYSPILPETITFSSGVNNVQIWVNGQGFDHFVTLAAFDSDNNILSVNNVSTNSSWNRLVVGSSGAPIDHVTLVSANTTDPITFDNLSFGNAPEPGSFGLALPALAGLATFLKRRKHV